MNCVVAGWDLQVLNAKPMFLPPKVIGIGFLFVKGPGHINVSDTVKRQSPVSCVKAILSVSS